MLTFDIETVPTAKALAMPYPKDRRSPPANYKSDEAIAKWYATDEATWTVERVKECSLNPRLGRVVAIAWDDATEHGVDIAETEADEADTLARYWAWVRKGRVIGGFNSHGFDFPFLLTRSLILGVSPGIDVSGYLRRYNHTPHFDVRMALTGWDVRQSGTLADWCEAFGLDSKAGDGSQVYGMVERREWGALSAYAVADVLATRALVERVAPTFGVAL